MNVGNQIEISDQYDINSESERLLVFENTALASTQLTTGTLCLQKTVTFFIQPPLPIVV